MMPLSRMFRTVWRYFLPRAECTPPIVLEPAPILVDEPPARTNPVRVTAVDLLRNEPDISAAELSQRAGVTLSYASVLVRRNRPKPVAVAPVKRVTKQLHLEEDEPWTQIENATASGMTSSQIAEHFSITTGEVEFALKIARLKKNKLEV